MRKDFSTPQKPMRTLIDRPLSSGYLLGTRQSGQDDDKPVVGMALCIASAVVHMRSIPLVASDLGLHASEIGIEGPELLYAELISQECSALRTLKTHCRN
jgi:hypothetical protein